MACDCTEDKPASYVCTACGIVVLSENEETHRTWHSETKSWTY